MAGIIKSNGRQSVGSGLPESAVFNFEDMTIKADRYLDGVRRQGDAIIADAQAKAVQVAQDAIQKLRDSVAAEAAEHVQQELSAKLDDLVPALQKAIQEVDIAKQVWIQHWEQETVALAIAIAERIARRELERQPEIQVDLIREALQLALGGGALKLHLNPADCETIQPSINRLVSGVGEQVPTEIVSDPSVSAGGCRVVTQFGSIDQTIESQLARIEEELIS